MEHSDGKSCNKFVYNYIFILQSALSIWFVCGHVLDNMLLQCPV